MALADSPLDRKKVIAATSMLPAKIVRFQKLVMRLF